MNNNTFIAIRVLVENKEYSANVVGWSVDLKDIDTNNVIEHIADASTLGEVLRIAAGYFEAARYSKGDKPSVFRGISVIY